MRHHLGGEAAQALPAARTAAGAAAVDQHIADAGPAQFVELLGDVVGAAVHRAVAVDRVGVAGGAVGPAMHGAVGLGRELQLAHPIGEPAFERRLLFGGAVADEEGAGDADRQRVETAAACASTSAL